MDLMEKQIKEVGNSKLKGKYYHVLNNMSNGIKQIIYNNNSYNL